MGPADGRLSSNPILGRSMLKTRLDVRMATWSRPDSFQRHQEDHSDSVSRCSNGVCSSPRAGGDPMRRRRSQATQSSCRRTSKRRNFFKRQMEQAMFQILLAKGDLCMLARGDPARPQMEESLIPLHARNRAHSGPLHAPRAHSGRSSASSSPISRCLLVRGIINIRISRST